ncbi:MAG TPA: DUF4159 domain-containing protein [Acetobacteraceae bacterium]|nr:DUF4159 domain-containing protein [Acetobacteraceae bacterium]
MIFAAPWLLLALPALPLLWWLLRVTPPAPRTEHFPAIRLLAGLQAREETPAHTPWWLLVLRMLAAALVIVGLARPVLDAGARLAGHGPLLLVIDNGWAASADWPARLQAAQMALDRAEREGRRAVLLTTATDDTGAAPHATGVMPVADLRSRLGALRPMPWPVDRRAAAAALRGWAGRGTVAYVADGIAAADDRDFDRALAAVGPVMEIRPDPPHAAVMLPPRPEADRLLARVASLPQPTAWRGAVLAQSGDGRTLGRYAFTVPAGAPGAEVGITLPPELRNRLSRLVLAGPASAASIALLDEGFRRRPVGLVSPDASANAPLTGALYYLEKALGPYTELREGDVATLLKRDLSVLVLADEPLTRGPVQTALRQWVERGGLLLRFAGPRLAEASSQAPAVTGEEAAPEAGDATARADGLLPVRLLAGDRQLGGALSWSHPARLAPFPDDSPFAGLHLPDDVTVSRQVLAEPSATLSGRVWARLADGTPLVTARPLGQGRIVLFHVTANADWSNLPLSGLFVDMLRRLVALSVGVATPPGHAMLAPQATLDGFGTLGQPPAAATALRADRFAATPVSPQHPPGLYGPENGRRALNLGAALPPLRAAPPVPGARLQPLGAQPREREIGPWLLVAALALLALDLLLSLRLRGLLAGLLRPAALSAALVATLALPAAPARAQDADVEAAALHTRLAYVVTGDDQVDAISRAGLSGLSDYVNRRTAATLADPAAVVPGRDDLSVYPLLYWPITADAAPSPQAVAALNTYMRHDGIILIDTLGAGGGEGGSDQGFTPGEASLQRATQGLQVPPLAPLTTAHVLARSFYLLNDFPGRYDNGTVWVQRDQDRSNDSVSPVIIGDNDWAAAWAVDADGRNPYAVMPGGARQRTLAYRFGVNLVMYALTGNYKGDQVHVPAILERLGQ